LPVLLLLAVLLVCPEAAEAGIEEDIEVIRILR